MDASAWRADEGRATAPIGEEELRGRVDPSISEWGNPTGGACDLAVPGGNPGN